jgi:hypothetical protein
MDWYADDFGIEDQIYEFNNYLERIKQVGKPEIVAVANLMTSEKRWGLSLVGSIDQALADELYEIVAPIWG